MSDRIVVTELDPGSVARLVTALDALPVPVGPRALRGRTTSRRRSRLSIAFAVVVLAVAAGLSVAPVREAVGEAAKWLERILIGPAWTGYFVDLSGSDVAGLPRSRVMFSDGTTPRPTVPDVASRYADHGPWSADGELMIVYAGPKLYVGDRDGRVRQITDLGDFEVVRTSWVGERQVAVLAQGTSARISLFRVNLLDLSVFHTAIEAPVFASAFLGAFAPPSPDARWLPVALGAGSCGEVSGLYELDTGRLIDVTDGTGRRLTAIGWLRDGRLLSAFCDPATSRAEYYLGAPGSAGTPIATVAWSRSVAFPVADRARDRFLVMSPQADGSTSVNALDADGRILELVRLPAVGRDEPFTETIISTLSRDGRFLSFRVRTAAFERAVRAGVIEVATRRITYVCEQGCARLALR